MATVKEIRLMKDGAMVTPVTLIGSVKNLDGTEYSSHTHDDRYYTESEIDSKVSTLNTAINGKAPSNHTHAISDITNLQSTLNGKAASSHSHAVYKTVTSGGALVEQGYDSGYAKTQTTYLPDLAIGEIAFVKVSYTVKHPDSYGPITGYIKVPTNGTYLIYQNSIITVYSAGSTVDTYTVSSGETKSISKSYIMVKTA